MFTALGIIATGLAALIGGYCVGRSDTKQVNVFVTKTAQLPPAFQGLCDEVNDEDEEIEPDDEDED